MALLVITGLSLLCCILCLYGLFTVPRLEIKIIAGLGALIAGAPVGILLMAAGSIAFGWTYHVQTLDCGGDRKIEIRAPHWNDETHPVRYQVRGEHGEVFEWPRTFTVLPQGIYNARELKFVLHRAEPDHLFAVTEQREPAKVLILHDFDAGWSWAPMHDQRLPDEPAPADQREGMARMRAAHPDLVFPE